MSQAENRPTSTEISRYVRGRLEADRSKEIEALASQNRELAARIWDLQELEQVSFDFIEEAELKRLEKKQ